MRFWSGLLWGLFCAGTAWGGFVVEPQQLAPGGVAMVSWQGDEPLPAETTVDFAGNRAPFFTDAVRPFALIGVDLDQAPGRYPLVVAIRGADGQPEHVELSLQVQGEERPVERLSLPRKMVTPTAPRTLQRIREERQQLNRLFAERSTPLRWTRFTPPLQGDIISTFGRRRILNGEEKAPHNGIDYRAKAGTPVAAMGAGRVVLAGDLYYTGKTVILDHGGGLYSVYAHLRSLAVRHGKAVAAGALVGEVGSTGRSTGPHLHVGMRLAGARIDPLALLGLLGGKRND